MGPRSSDRGYEGRLSRERIELGGFNGSTVLRPWLWLCHVCMEKEQHEASMGPRSSDRGYGDR